MSRNFGERRNLISRHVTVCYECDDDDCARSALGTIGVVIGCFDSDRYVIAPNRETQLARHFSRSCSHSSPSWNWNSPSVFRNIGRESKRGSTALIRRKDVSELLFIVHERAFIFEEASRISPRKRNEAAWKNLPLSRRAFIPVMRPDLRHGRATY